MVLDEAVGSEWLVFSHAFHLIVTIGKRVLKHLSSSFYLFSSFCQDRLCHDRHDFLFYNFLCYLTFRFGFVGVLCLLSISRLLFFVRLFRLRNGTFDAVRYLHLAAPNHTVGMDRSALIGIA